MGDPEGTLGDPIDPDTACLGCGTQDSPETMLICEQCQQGFHLGCFGLATIPEEDEWECWGCVELQRLAPGQAVVVESPQTLYGAG